MLDVKPMPVGEDFILAPQDRLQDAVKLVELVVP